VGWSGGTLQGCFNFSEFSGTLSGNNKYISGILSSNQLIGTLFVQIGQKGGPVCMPKSQSHTRMGVGRRGCESKGAANPSKLAV